MNTELYTLLQKLEEFKRQLETSCQHICFYVQILSTSPIPIPPVI